MSKNIIDKLYREGFNKALREQLQKQKGQLIFINDISAFRSALKDTLGSSVYISEKQKRLMLEAGREKARRLHNAFYRYNKSRFNTLLNKIYSANLLANGEILGIDAFLVSRFDRSIKIIKTAMLKALQNSRQDIGPQEYKTINDLIHRGHGTRGEAVSEVQIALGYQALVSGGLSDKDIENHLQNAVTAKALDLTANEVDNLKELLVTYSQVVNSRGVRADYVSRITFQFSKENIGADAVVEKKILNTFYTKFIPYLSNVGILDLQGSSTLKEKVAAEVISNFTKIKGAKIKVDKKINPNTVSKATKGSIKQPILKGTKSISKKISTKVTTKKAKVKAKSTVNLKSLIPVFNQQISKQVAKNMGSPRLNYRTGRFANSIRVTDITETNKGYPSIAYTYQRNPYEVFEWPGGSPRLATPQRDPRNIIELSIREIAKGLINGRFYTRRQ